MSKQILKSLISDLKSNKYTWSLYFFKMDLRSNQPYKTFRIKFKRDNYLTDYIEMLIKYTEKYQIDPISEVQQYDGENTKVTCDKIDLNNDLIKGSWNNMIVALANATNQLTNEKLNGYIIEGHPENSDLTSVTLLRFANPLTTLKSKKAVVFSSLSGNELDMVSDDMYRLYLNADCIVYGNTIYTFNHSFEKIFKLEKTMDKVKEASIGKIQDISVFDDPITFKNYAFCYKSSRTFLTLCPERIERIKNIEQREQIAALLHIAVDDNKNLVIDSQEKANIIIQYLCHKIIIDAETNEVLYASTLTPVVFPD